jgi:hypothetical protein
MNQQVEECIALTRFREASGLLPGIVERVVSDPPDFLITDGRHRTAVEMTRYLQLAGRRGSKIAQREAMEIRVVERAQQIFEAAHPGLHVNVSPSFKIEEIKPGEVESYAKALSNLVTVVLAPDPTVHDRTTSSRADWDTMDGAGLEHVLANLYTYRWWSADASQWGSFSGMASADPADIEARIRDKERDLSRYSVSADERWLIIYAWMLRSAFFDIEVLRPQMFSSQFDRVVFFDAPVARFVHIA